MGRSILNAEHPVDGTAIRSSEGEAFTFAAGLLLESLVSDDYFKRFHLGCVSFAFSSVIPPKVAFNLDKVK